MPESLQKLSLCHWTVHQMVMVPQDCGESKFAELSKVYSDQHWLRCWFWIHNLISFENYLFVCAWFVWYFSFETLCIIIMVYWGGPYFKTLSKLDTDCQAQWQMLSSPLGCQTFLMRIDMRQHISSVVKPAVAQECSFSVHENVHVHSHREGRFCLPPLMTVSRWVHYMIFIKAESCLSCEIVLSWPVLCSLQLLWGRFPYGQCWLLQF